MKLGKRDSIVVISETFAGSEYAYTVEDFIIQASMPDYTTSFEWMKAIFDERLPDEPEIEAIDYLNHHGTPHHYEHAETIFEMKGEEWRREAIIFVVYDRNVAFQLRMRFGLLPMPGPDWRRAFSTGTDQYEEAA